MASRGFALFETAIGTCAIAWGERGITGVQLPEKTPAATRARMKARFPDSVEASPPRAAKAAIGAVGKLLRGETAALTEIVLDMEGVPPFHRRVYEAARAVGPGETTSYGGISERLGKPGSARAVGQALGRNPFAIIVPCHRVLAAGGKVGGFTATGGVTTKRKMLAIEEGAQPARKTRKTRTRNPYGFDPEVAAAHVRAADPKLARVIDQVGPFAMRLKDTDSLFTALAESVVYQQLTGKAAATIYGRVCALFPGAAKGPEPHHVLQVSEDTLRGAGLSRAKFLSLKDLAEHADSGRIPTLAEARALDDDELVRRLTEVRGIGRWTVEMLLMFRLGRADVLPLDDYGIRKGFAVAFGKKELPDKKELAKRGELWRPYRTLASWYLWRAVELGKR